MFFKKMVWVLFNTYFNYFVQLSPLLPSYHPLTHTATKTKYYLNRQLFILSLTHLS